MPNELKKDSGRTSKETSQLDDPLTCPHSHRAELKNGSFVCLDCKSPVLDEEGQRMSRAIGLEVE